MTEKKLDKTEIQKEFLETLKGLDEVEKVRELLKDNTIEFSVKDTKYRVRKPNYQEQLDVEKFRREKYIEFVDDDKMFFRKQWEEKYKKKGIDLDKMQIEMRRLQTEVDSLRIKLAQTDNKKDVESLTKQILELQGKQAVISVEYTDLLSYSIEDQLSMLCSSYYAYIVLEKRNHDGWKKVFDDYLDFVKSDNSNLVNQALNYVSHLIYNAELFTGD